MGGMDGSRTLSEESPAEFFELLDGLVRDVDGEEGHRF
jgi:hypothetical protein